MPKPRWLALSILWIALSAVFIVAQSSPATAPVLHSPAASEEAALHALTDQFFAAYSKKDLAAITALWSSHSPELAAQQKSIEQFFAANDKIEIRNLTIQQLQVDGDKAQLRVSFEMFAVDAKSGNPTPGLGETIQDIDFVKAATSWKLWRQADAIEAFAGRLSAAKNEEEQEELLKQDSGLITARLSQILTKQGGANISRGEMQQAEKTFQTVELIAAHRKDQAGIANATIALGVIHDMQGDHRGAIERYDRSLKIAETSQDKLMLTRILLNRGMSYQLLDDYDQSLADFTESLKLAESLQDKQRMAKLLSNIGESKRLQGNLDDAIEYYQKALSVAPVGGPDKATIPMVLHNIGVIYTYKGNYALAMDYMQKSLTTLGDSNESRVLKALFDGFGEIQRAQGDHESALDYYQKGLALSEKTGDQAGIAGFLVNIGESEQALGRYAAAMDHFQKSQALFEQLGAKDGTLTVLLNIGHVQDLQGQTQLALDFFKKSLALAESLGDQRSIAMAAGDVASAYVEQHKFEDALLSAQHACEAARQAGVRDALWRALEVEGLAYNGVGNRVQARHAFEEAVSTIEVLRNEVAGGEQQQQSFFSERLSPYYDLVELFQTENQPFEALTYAERAKARVLLDVLHSGRVRITKAMTDVERDREQKLQSQLVSLNMQLQHASAAPKPDQAELSKVKERLESAQHQYNDFLSNLYVAHSDLKTQRAQAQSLNPDEAARLLPDSSGALLEFVTGSKKTYLFVLIRKGTADHPQSEIKVYPIPVTQKELEQKAERFRQQLGQRDLSFRSQARDLFDLLILPAQKQLAGKNALIIVPDGPLWNLPFQALLSAQNRYLLQDYAIGFAPSLTVLQEMIRLRQRHSEEPASGLGTTLLAMGNPVVGAETGERLRLAYRDESLSPLPDAEAEVKTLQQLYGPAQSQIYVGTEAREARFKAEAGNSRLLHLATHGFLNDASPMYSHIVLAASEGDTKEDGLLETWEIMQLDLKADLAVLSACETARGHVSAGEGVIGLAWAFFVAGTPTTVVSQWKVESSSTTQLMTAFHRARKAKLGQAAPFATARALREAELQLLNSKQYAHPFYWASFVEVGNPN